MRRTTLLSLSLAVSIVAAGCQPAGDDRSCVAEPCLAPPDVGVQVRSVGTTIEPGQDVELCEVVKLPGAPGEAQYAGRIEIAMTEGSHHLIVAAIVPGSPTEAAVAEGDVVECVGPTGFGEDVTVLTGSQLAAYDESFPPDVARPLYGGQYLVFNYHYLNATDAPIEARAAVNFHTVDGSGIAHLMGDASFINLGIHIPPGESRSFSTDCRFDRDVMVHKLSRHTHQWGTTFPVEFAGGPDDGEPIYVSPSYDVPDHVFERPRLVRAGDGFRFECNYVNTTGRALSFGFKTTDEMCILFAQIFSPDDTAAPVQGCIVAEPL